MNDGCVWNSQQREDVYKILMPVQLIFLHYNIAALRYILKATTIHVMFFC
jgi:hypothetical protein